MKRSLGLEWLIVATLFLCMLAPGAILLAQSWTMQELQEMEENMEHVCQNSAPVDCIKELTFLQRVHYGPYTLRQMPWVLDMHEMYERAQVWDEALDQMHMARWLLIRNEFSLQHYRDVIKALATIPELGECGERTDDGLLYRNQTDRCTARRLYFADTLVNTLELQMKIAEQTGDRAEWQGVYILAKNAEAVTLGIRGPDFIIDDRTLSMVPNHSIEPRYRWRRYTDIAREAQEILQ